MDEWTSRTRVRRKVESEEGMPVWYWLGPVGGSALLGIVTVAILFSGRGKQPAPRKEERSPPLLRQPPVEKPIPRVEPPPPPTDYSIPKVDYTKSLAGERVTLVENTARWRRDGYVNSKWKTIYHGKTQEFHLDSTIQASEEWFADGEKHGLSIAWDQSGIKTFEGSYFRGTRQGKWTTFRPNGSIAVEEMWYRGKKVGPSTTFHANGKKARTVMYRNDRRIGPAEAWDETGMPVSPDESLRADLESVHYDDMIDILGSPTELHEVAKARGSLHIWAMPGNRYIAVWVEQDRKGEYTKRDIRAFQVTREAIDKLKRDSR